MTDLCLASLAELREMCQLKGLPYKKKSKEQLISLLVTPQTETVETDANLTVDIVEYYTKKEALQRIANEMKIKTDALSKKEWL